MAGMRIHHVLVIFYAIVALNCVSTLPKDVNFPVDEENFVENSESVAYPPPLNSQLFKMAEQEDRPKSCFHFFVSRNMSSLLAEATKMLRTIRDRREREWILTFIYRIKSLAEHLRAHPDSRNYGCLPTDDEAKKRILSDNVKGQQQPELYFVDEIPKRSNGGEGVLEKVDGKTSNDNQESNILSKEDQSNPSSPPKQEMTGTSNDKDLTSSTSRLQAQSSAKAPLVNSPSDSSDEQTLSKHDTTPPEENRESTQRKEIKEETLDNSIIVSSIPDCDVPVACDDEQPPSSPEVPQENNFADDGNSFPQYQSDDERERDFDAEELYRQEILKKRIRKALLEELAPEIKKFKTVGGTPKDLMGLWHSNYGQEGKSMGKNEEADFDYEETGAAAGDLNLNEKVQPDRTVAPSLDEVQNSKESSNTAKDSSYEPYDDSDDLVQQLFEVRFDDAPSKTTKSLSDQNNDYLITSTYTPY